MKNSLRLFTAGIALGALLLASPASAKVRLPAIFSEHMVLQAGRPVPVWGWADAGEEVVVQIGSQTKSTRAGADGKWRVQLDPLVPGGPFVLQAGELSVADVLAGEVWIGSGQSNMGFPFKMNFFPFLTVKDYEREKAAANFPQIRMFLLDSGTPSPEPQEDCRGRWLVTKPENVDTFSAVLFFFGRELYQALGQPVGLIKSAVGGSAIELWIDEKVQRAEPRLQKLLELEEHEKDAFDPAAAEAKYQAELEKWKTESAAATAAGKTEPRKPVDPMALNKRNYTLGGLFNSKIAPIIPYAIRGVVWYQGESNAGQVERTPYYGVQLPLLINDWRKRWGYDFPFAWVQIANLELNTGNWPLVREAMLETLRVPNTGMAVSIDVGEAHNIHPRDKQSVGHRLALWALGTVYGRDNATSGPLPAGMEKRGRELALAFTHTDGGLVARGGDLRGFLIAGTDRKWHPAAARIDGQQVVVSSPEVAEPTAARYSWATNPDGNLYNGAGLPASPFRTDRDNPDNQPLKSSAASP